MREIVLDTETTGLEPQQGHRIIEIGCVELINYIPTGKVYHTYINPERDVPAEASAISGLKTDFLKPFPLFSAIAQDFLTFIGNDKLVIHNAAFDMKFLNSELDRLNYPLLEVQRSIDTLKIARTKFPGSPASLDALCRCFRIDLSNRTLHGALLDAQLLAKVYLELVGGRQTAFGFEPERPSKTNIINTNIQLSSARPLRSARPHEATPEELALHQNLLKTIKNNLWEH